MGNNIIGVLRTVMGCVTAAFILACLLGGLIGFFKGWKRSLVNLCRTLTAVLLAFLTALIIFRTTPTVPYLENLLNNALGDSFEMSSIMIWLNMLVLTIIVPFIFLILFAIYTQLLRIPAYFIAKALGITKKKKNEQDDENQSEASDEYDAESQSVNWDDPNNPPSFEAYSASMNQGNTKTTEEIDEITEEIDKPTAENDESSEPSELQDEAEPKMNEDGTPVLESAVEAGSETVPEAEPEKSKNEKLYSILGKCGGALITATAVFIVILVSLLPISGLLYTITDGISGVTKTAADLDINLNTGGDAEDKTVEVDDYVLVDKEGNVKLDEIDEMTNDYIKPVANNFFVKCSYSAPMRLLYNGMLGSKTADGSVRSEFAQLFKLGEDALYLLIDPKDFGEDQKTAIAGITAYVSASDIHSKMVADVISSVSVSILEDKEVMGMDTSVVVDENVSELTIPLLEILKESDSESVKAFFNTIRDFLNTLIDYDVAALALDAIDTESADNIYDLASNGDFLSDVLGVLYANEEIRELIVPTINYTFTLAIRSFDTDHESVNVADRSVIENLSSAALDNEARLIADLMKDIQAVLDTIYEISSDTAATDAIVEADLTSLGRFIDKARTSIFVGKGINEITIAMLNSSAFNSMRDVADILIEHIESGETISWENMLVAVQQFNSILNSYKNNSSQDTAALAETLKALSNSFSDESTAKIMKQIINESSILQSAALGGTSDNQNSQKLMTVFIDQLASGEITEEEYEKEAKALDYAMQIVKVSGESKETQTESLKSIYGDKDGMYDMIRTMATSKMTIASINAVAYETDENGEPLHDAYGNKILTPDALAIANELDEQDKADLLKQCEEVYHEERTKDPNADASVLEDNLKAVASVFGMDISSDIAEWSSHYRN